MDPAAVELVLSQYPMQDPMKDLQAGYAPAGKSSTQSSELHFQLRTINGKKIVIVRLGTTSTLVFKEFDRIGEIGAYLGDPPESAALRDPGNSN